MTQNTEKSVNDIQWLAIEKWALLCRTSNLKYQRIVFLENTRINMFINMHNLFSAYLREPQNLSRDGEFTSR